MNLFNKHKYKHLSMLSLCVYHDIYDPNQSNRRLAVLKYFPLKSKRVFSAKTHVNEPSTQHEDETSQSQFPNPIQTFTFLDPKHFYSVQPVTNWIRKSRLRVDSHFSLMVGIPFLHLLSGDTPRTRFQLYLLKY